MALPTKGSRHTNQLGDVFVIGAGASVAYGFPTGADLLKAMRNEVFGPDDAELIQIIGSIEGRETASLESLRRSWLGSNEKFFCEGWIRLIRGSVILTIDQFLRNLQREQFRDFGKRLMARQILHAERKACEPGDEAILGSMHRIDWIQEFLTRVDLLSNWQEYLWSCTFITFNYDRVLEFYLRRYLEVDREMSRQQADENVRSLKIIHLNGSLGTLEELPFGNLAGGGDVGHLFDPLFDTPTSSSSCPDWNAIAERMRTVWEPSEDRHDQNRQNAQSAIRSAQRVFAIGMSFIPENLMAAGMVKEDAGAEISWPRGSFWATRKGLSDAQTARAAHSLGIQGKRLIDCNARDFIVDHVVL